MTGRVVAASADGTARSGAEVAAMRQSYSNLSVDGSFPVEACSSSTDEGVKEGTVVAAPSGSATCRIHCQRASADTAVCRERTSQKTENAGQGSEYGRQACQITTARSEAYLPRKYDTASLAIYLGRHSSKQPFLQPIRERVTNYRPIKQDTTESPRCIVEYRKVMCCGAEDALTSHTVTQGLPCNTMQQWSEVPKRLRKKRLCRHPSKTPTALSSGQEKIGEAAQLGETQARCNANCNLNPGNLRPNKSIEDATLLHHGSLCESPIFNIKTRCCPVFGSFEKLAETAGSMPLFPCSGPLNMARQTSVLQLQGNDHLPFSRDPRPEPKRGESIAFQVNELHYESCIGKLATTKGATKWAHEEYAVPSLYQTGSAATKSNRRTLSRICKIFQAQQIMRICFGSWLKFCWKSRELRLQQELQNLRTLKSTAMNCLLRWTSVFVAVGARKIFLSLRGLRAFVVVASHRHQILHIVYSRVYNTAVPVFGFGPVVGVATQVHERNIKHRTVSCWRKEAAKYGKVEQARRCLEATVLVRLHHRYWSAWVDLLRQRQKLCRAIFTTTKVTASAARAIIADAFYVLRRAGIVGASYSERKLRQATRNRTIRWIRHWKIVAHRKILHRTLVVEATNRTTWQVWQAWRHATTESTASTRQLAHNAAEFLVENNIGQCYLAFEAWREYTAMQLRLKASTRAFLQKTKRRVFGEMKWASEENRLLRERTALCAKETRNRIFIWWLMHYRRRKRNNAVSQLIAVGGNRTCAHEAFLAWAEVTSRWLEAKALQRRSLQVSHWLRWNTFANSRRRRRAKAGDLQAFLRTSGLQKLFRVWKLGAQERMAAKLQAFTAWQQYATYCRGLSSSKQSIRALQCRSILITTFTAWEREARLQKHSRKLAKTALCKKTLEAFKTFTSYSVRVREARKSVCAKKHLELLSSVFGEWNKLQWRFQELRQLQQQAMSKLRQRRIQAWWAVWKRRAATATSLRRWVQQAVGSPMQVDRVPFLHVSRQTPFTAAQAEEKAAWTADAVVECPLQYKETATGSSTARQSASTRLEATSFPSYKHISRQKILPQQLPATKRLSISSPCNEIPQDILIGNERGLVPSGLKPRGRDAGEGKTENHSPPPVQFHSGSVALIPTYNAKLSTSRKSIARQRCASGIICTTSFKPAAGNGGESFKSHMNCNRKALRHCAAHSSCELDKRNALAYHRGGAEGTKQGRPRFLLRRRLKIWADQLLLLYWKRKLQQVLSMWMLLASEK